MKRGVLIDSFDETSSFQFISTVPELYLYQWALSKQLNVEVRSLLWQILKTRFEFTPVKFEIIHINWEQLMRYVRKGRLEYARIPLNGLYRLTLRNGASPAASCLVDGCGTMKEIKYVKGTNITLQPDTIYNPSDTLNAGWDRLIVLEASEVSAVSSTSERYLLPLFVQNIFNEENKTTILSVADVNTANDHCKQFMKNRIMFDSGFSPLPTIADDVFILLITAKDNSDTNVFEVSPSNAMFCFGEDLEKLYGPSLKGLLRKSGNLILPLNLLFLPLYWLGFVGQG